MAKSIGTNKNAIAVFISGRGTNLKSLIKYSSLKKSNFTVKLIISNKKTAKGLIYAKKNKISYLIIDFKNKKKSENKILSLLKKKKIRLICLAGYMKIISAYFIKKFNGNILNIHPSLLPKYKGLSTHKKVIENKDKYSGFTIHLVNKQVDSGKIIFQKKIKVLKNDDPKKLEKRILKGENKFYPIKISEYISNLQKRNLSQS